MSDELRVAREDEAPLNLKIHRAEFGKRNRPQPVRPVPLLEFMLPGALLWTACRRSRFAVPAAAALAGGSLAALIATIVSRRRHSAREAVIDAQIEQSFPASDPPSI